MVHEWNGHVEIFSRRPVIENCRQYLLLRTDIVPEKSRWVFPLSLRRRKIRLPI